MSAPTQKTNGLPGMKTAALQSPALELVEHRDRGLERRAPERRRLAVVHRRCRSFTSATEPARFNLKTVSLTVAFSQRSRSHAPCRCRAPFKPSGDAALAQAVRELRDQAHARCGERMPRHADRAAVRVQTRDRRPRLRVRRTTSAPGRRTARSARRDRCRRSRCRPARARAASPAPGHSPSGAARRPRMQNRRGDSLRRETELRDSVLGREERGGRAVGQPGGVPGSHASARAKRRPSAARDLRATCRGAGNSSVPRASSRRP